MNGADPTPASGTTAPFDHVFDVAVVGTGHAGFAAALRSARRGLDVLMLGARGDLVWESGRGFCPHAGDSDDDAWQELAGQVEQRGGRADGWLDGAITEVVATDQLLTSGVSVLYYARPVAAERAGDVVTSVLVATKSGLRRVAARQWVDATETGELMRLIDPHAVARPPSHAYAYLMMQHQRWPGAAGLELRPTAWPTERVLAVEVRPGDPAWRDRVLAALDDLEACIGGEIADVCLSHLSMEPVAEYESGTAQPNPAPNVASAVPGHSAGAVVTLADRFLLGVAAADAAATSDSEGPAADLWSGVWSRPLSEIEVHDVVEVDVCVAGVGTGGALAALAAATAGARVAGIEALTLLGGIGTGGGIHGYFYGVPGGLQQEVDRRTKQLMKRYRRGPLGYAAFNPWAKMITLEHLLRERDVRLLTDALVFGVERQDDRIVAVLAATGRGVVRVAAVAFVDGSGDGDLCALAGARFTAGREHDGLCHSYTQSSGMLREARGRPRMGFVNFVAGFCDTWEPADLTRARLAGIRQYLLPRYDNLSRPTYLAPVLGLRQSRQVITEYVLTLDDQIRRRRFDDPIGYTGAHVENHTTDHEFGSDEAIFWNWTIRQWNTPVGCEISYRMLVPRGLSNVWIGSRCLGVSQDAHYATRMQRDMQRVGEASGFAAALAAANGYRASQLPYDELRHWLDRTGALDTRKGDATFGFGSGSAIATQAAPITDERTADEAALATLDRGEPTASMWWLYQRRARVSDAVLARLAPGSGRPTAVTWLAAGIAAMWGDPRAETRLIEAIRTEEYGFGGEDGWSPTGYNLPRTELRIEPMTWAWIVPNWLCAVALLRRCGTATCLPTIEQLVHRPIHGINTLTTAAMTLDQLVRRGALADIPRERLAELLDAMMTTPVIGTMDYPARPVGRYAELALRGGTDAAGADMVPLAPGIPVRDQLPNTYEDNSWQLHYAVARVRSALGMPVDAEGRPFRSDPRGYVRRAFAALA